MVVLKLNLASLPKHPSSSTPSSQPPPVATARAASAVGLPSIPRIRVKSAASASTKIRIKNQKDVGLGYDSEASDREEDPAIEEQIILRCRPGEDAEYLRGCLERKEVPDMMIKFKDLRRAVVRIRRNLYGAKLVDLPTILESSKTLDRKSLYKTADICQMLVIGDPIQHEDTILAYPSKASDYIYPHGITPPLRWVRKRRFRKRISNRTIEQVESRLDELLKADSEAKSVSYEIVLPHSHTDTRSNSLAPSDIESPMPLNEDELMPSDNDASEEGSEDDFAGELEQMVQEADTPVPTPQDGDEESESDESEGDIEGAEDDVEGEKLKAQREQEIRELEETIMQKRIAVTGIVNPIVRSRVLEGLGRLEGELMLKRRQLEDEEEG